MTVEEAVLSRILDLPAVTDITSTRWYLVKLPQSPTYPAGRVTLIDEPSTYHLRGPDNTTRSRVQVDAYVSESTAASAGRNPYQWISELAAAVDGDGLGSNASGLSGWIGDVGSPPFLVRGSFRIDRDVRFDAEERNILTIRQDYYVWWRQG